MPPTHLNPGNKGKYFVLILQSQPRGQRIIETSSLDLTIPRGGRVDGLMRESLSSSLGQVQWGRWKCSGLSVPSSLAGWLSPVCCALHGPPQTPSNQHGLLTKGTATLSASPESSALGRGRSCHVPACFTLSQRGDSIHQNSSTKTSLQRPDYNLHHSAHPHVFQKPSLDTFSSCIPAFMGQAHGILSSDNLTIQMDSPWKEILSFSHYVMSDSMRPRRLQHTRLLCPPLSPRVCSDSCPLSQWCYLTISPPATLFSFCFQSFPSVAKKHRLITLPSILPSLLGRGALTSSWRQCWLEKKNNQVSSQPHS